MSYMTLINTIDPTINAAGVEASMRLQYSTLDHLSHEQFVQEVRLAHTIEEDSPGFLKRVATSHGYANEFEHEVQRIAASAQTPAPPTPSTRSIASSIAHDR